MSTVSTPPEPVHFDRFAAIDFETADYGRDSACAIAVVIVNKGRIVEEYYSLIRPPRRYFQFTWLHGISWEDVADKPAFGDLWPEIAARLHDAEFIAAHNATFDRGVLSECCIQTNCVLSDTRFLCTMRLARQLWNIYPTKLSDVCGLFDIPLVHHHAGSDALACARIVLKAYGSGVPKKAFLKTN